MGRPTKEQAEAKRQAAIMEQIARAKKITEAVVHAPLSIDEDDLDGGAIASVEALTAEEMAELRGEPIPPPEPDVEKEPEPAPEPAAPVAKAASVYVVPPGGARIIKKQSADDLVVCWSAERPATVIMDHPQRPNMDLYPVASRPHTSQYLIIRPGDRAQIPVSYAGTFDRVAIDGTLTWKTGLVLLGEGFTQDESGLSIRVINLGKDNGGVRIENGEKIGFVVGGKP